MSKRYYALRYCVTTMDIIEKSDSELVAAFCDSNDQAAMTEIHRRYEKLVFSVCRRYLNVDADAEDAAIACFMVFARKAGSLRKFDSLAGWFYWCAAGAARNAMRILRTRTEHEKEAHTMINNAEQKNPWNEMLPQLEMEIANLPATMREALVLNYYQGLSRSQIAAKLRCPEGTVGSRLRLAVARLRARMTGTGAAMTENDIASTLAGSALLLPVPVSMLKGLAAIADGSPIPGAASAIADLVTRGMFLAKVKVAAVAASVVILAGGGVFSLAQIAGDKAPAANGDKPEPPKPAARAAAFEPAPMNENKGQQMREEVFAFAKRPSVRSVRSDGSVRYAIAFETTAKCDATITVHDKDGKVVRRLASGVLGPNAPWPFKQDSLAQSIEWDGRDDFGKPAPEGCKVKVGLGLKYTFERTMGWSPDSMAGASLVVGKDGTVYSVSGGSIRVFDRDGKYLRTLLPPQGGLNADQYAAFPLMKTTYGDSVFYSDWMGPFASLGGVVGSCAITPDGSRLLSYTAGDPYRDPMQLMVVDTKTGALPKDGLRKIGHVTDTSGGKANKGIGVWGVDPTFQTTQAWPRTRLSPGLNIACAPDGDMVYFSGIHNAVYRRKLSELTFTVRFGQPTWGVKPEAEKQFPELFLGERDKPGNDEKHFNRTTGIATDKDGNIYVGDYFNNRIQVFTPDGTFIATMKANKPGQIAVNRKTGAVYYADTSVENAALVKLGGLADPAVKAKFDAPYKQRDKEREAAISPALGVDCEANPPIVWFCVGGKVFRLLDKPEGFEKSAELVGKGGGVDFSTGQRLAVDPETDVFYYSSGSRITSPAWLKFDGKTGEHDPSFKSGGWEDMIIGADGKIYCRTGGYGRFVVRFDRNWNPLPFKRGVPPSVKVAQPYGGEPPHGWPADGKAIYVGVNGHSNVWQPGIAVDARGNVYVRTQGVTEQWYNKRLPANKPLPADEVEAKWSQDMPDWKASKGANVKNLLSVWDADGNEVIPSAIDNLMRGAGVGVDANGSIYVSIGRVEFKWRELAPESQPDVYRSWGSQGSIFKFRSLGGKFPLGDTANKNFKDAAWTYAGHAPCCPDDCGCCHSKFHVDLFGRAFVPAMQLYSIMILDANGNKIMRLGRYANPDSRGKDSLAPDPDLGMHWVLAVTTSDRALYFSDAGNRRIVKAALSYAAEEGVELK